MSIMYQMVYIYNHIYQQFSTWLFNYEVSSPLFFKLMNIKVTDPKHIASAETDIVWILVNCNSKFYSFQ